MELKYFSYTEQQQIQHRLSTAVISDKDAAEKILGLLPDGWVKKFHCSSVNAL